MKKVVLKLDGLDDQKNKAKVMKTVSSLSGLDSISMDVKDKKLTVIGDIDPIDIVSKLRKLCHAELVSVGPAKEPKNMKEEPKKQEDQKEKDQDPVAELVKAYKAYNPQSTTYNVTSVEDNPNACVIS